MRKRGLPVRWVLLLFAALALITPILLFAGIIQSRIWTLITRNVNTELEFEVDMADQVISMILDKYHALLYDFSSNEDFVEALQRLETDRMDEDASLTLQQDLNRLLSRNEQVTAVALVTAEGEEYHADGGEAWPEEFKDEDMELWGRAIYLTGTQETEEGETVPVLRIIHPIQDESDEWRSLATIVMSVSQSVIWDAYPPKSHSRMYVVNDDQIIAARDPSMIGVSISQLDRESHWVRSKKNLTTGWTVYDYYSTREYGDMVASQRFLLSVTVIVVVLIGMVLIYLLLRPILREMEKLEEAMNCVKRGDFSVKLDQPGFLGRMKEIRSIVDGFNGMVENTGQLMEQVKTAARDQREAELSAMEAQIDPHFLYNTLDTINWKAIEREEYEISGMLCALADILRYSIRNPGDTVTVGQEFYWVNQYILLQKARMEQPVEVETNVPEELKGYRVHKLLLQPFVENSIRHGFHLKEGTAQLKIRLRQVDRQLYFMIQDNGRGISPDILKILNDPQGELKGHVGIQNVRKRLKLYYGDDAECYFESREDVGTTVHLFVALIGQEGGSLSENCSH